MGRMDRLRRAAVLVRLMERLRERGSWCGETHVQKTTLFLQELMRVPLGFRFILYKHGPFSFDLRDDLTSLRADGLVTLEPRWGYGPRLATTEQSRYIQGLYPITLQQYNDSISFVSEKLGDKQVKNLEKLATSLYLKRPEETRSIDDRADELVEIKPHIAKDEAVVAMREVDQIIEEARRQEGMSAV